MPKIVLGMPVVVLTFNLFCQNLHLLKMLYERVCNSTAYGQQASAHVKCSCFNVWLFSLHLRLQNTQNCTSFQQMSGSRNVWCIIRQVQCIVFEASNVTCKTPKNNTAEV